MMRLIHSAAVNVLAVALTAIAGVLAIGALARLLSVEEFGRIAILLAVANAIAIFEGLRPVVVYEVANSRLSWDALFLAARRITFVTAGLLGLAAFIVTGGVSAIGFSWIESLVAGFMVCAFFGAVFFWSFLDADGETAFSGGVRGLAWICLYASFVLLAMLGSSFSSYLVALTVMNAVLAVVYRQRLLGRHVLPDWRSVSPDAVALLLRPALQNVATNVSAVTISISDRLVIGTMLGAGPAGLYSGASEFATKPTALLRAVAQVLYPRAALLATQPPMLDRAWRLLTTFAVLLAFSGTTVVILLREALVTILLGDRYAPAAGVFAILCAAFTMSVMGYAAVIYLNARGDFTTQRRLYGIAAVAMLFALIVVTPRWGVEGVAWTYFAARSVDVVMYAMIVGEQPASDSGRLLGMLCAGVLACALAWRGHALLTFGALLLAWLLGYWYSRGIEVARMSPVS
jgi:PST family polysaccharide transporter